MVQNENKEVNYSTRPRYYGGAENLYEAIKIIQAHDLNFALGNVVKYVLRAGKKNVKTKLEDLKKAVQYIQFEIEAHEHTTKETPTAE